jgi:cobyrinic acid a,c-diamide synthase
VPFSFLIAAPSSGSGKTVLTLALLRAFADRGLTMVSAKAGPDFIDPEFHRAATGRACFNLDAWGMRGELLGKIAGRSANADGFIIEGAMGLFDGAVDGSGAAADLAVSLKCPAVLVVDAARQSQSVAALVHGFTRYRPDVNVAGVILNRIGSKRHEQMLREALAPLSVQVFGAVARSESLVLPSRHLGLVQASEQPDIETFISGAAQEIATQCDLDGLAELAWIAPGTKPCKPAIVPPGQVIAVAQDVAFSFAYPHLLQGWRDAGAQISFFSPLADEAVPQSEAVFLPGGYPELHAGRLSQCRNFFGSLRKAAESGAPTYGECGGFMVLGEGLIDAAEARHEMAGLLPLVTSFANKRRHLGYRRALLLNDTPFLGKVGQGFATHEFHYTSMESVGECAPMARIEDATGVDLGEIGMVRGNVAGSYLHIIDRLS